MKIVVLNGSPKGNTTSVTMKHVEFFMSVAPAHEYQLFEIAKKIKMIERDENELKRIVSAIDRADAIIWALPVYYYHVPAQMKRFIELVFERGARDYFAGKYATAVLTSGMVLDNLAMDYIQAISEDLGLRFIPGYSAEAILEKSLLVREHRDSFEQYVRSFILHAKGEKVTPRRYSDVVWTERAYRAPKLVIPVELKTDKKVVILTDQQNEDSNIAHMVSTYRSFCHYHTEVINLWDISLKSYCLGDAKCYFRDCPIKDDVYETYQKLLDANAVIFAGTVRERFWSSRFMMFINRGFFFGMRPVLQGKYVGFLISGPLRQNDNMRVWCEAYPQIRRMVVSGIVTDEDREDERITELIANLASTLEDQMEAGIIRPLSFIARGYHTITRDVVFELSGAKVKDHLYFKSHGMYDYPWNSINRWLRKLKLEIAFNLPFLRKRLRQKPTVKLIEPYRKVVQTKSSA